MAWSGNKLKKPSKPWLRYHKPGAAVKTVPSKPKRPRQLIWARLILLIGFHRFYLGQPWKGILFFLALFMALPIGMVSVIILDIEKIGPDALPASALIPYSAVYLVEYFRLPTLVRNANIKMFGLRAKHAPEMQGKIGPYAALRPIVSLIIFLYGFGFISTYLSWPQWTLSIMMLGLILGFLGFFIQLAQTTKRVKQEQNYD